MGQRFRMEMKQHVAGGIVRILVDRQTGVHYVVSTFLGSGGMTPLLDKDGKVVVSKSQ